MLTTLKFKMIVVLTVATSCVAVPSALYAASINDTVENQLLVQWKDKAGAIDVIETTNPDVAMALLQINPDVEHVERNVLRELSVFPDDPLADIQYHLKQTSDVDIDAGKAWNITKGSRDVVIAVIDTGVDLDHPDLIDNLWTNSGEIAGNGIDDDGNGFIDDVNGWDFVENDNDPNPTPLTSSFSPSVVTHGTHVSGIIGATGNNGEGVSGVNWKVSIMPIRVFDETGLSSAALILNGMQYARDNGAHIMNMSYGGGTSSTLESESISDAFDEGILSVAATGNEATNLNINPSYPACYSRVLGVAATDSTDLAASFSNFGTDCTDVAAPGVSILSTYYLDLANGFSEDYDVLSGTSMATPVVSGIAGLLKANNSLTSPGDMISIISDSADNITDKTLGSGRVNAYQALKEQQRLSTPGSMRIKAFKNNSRKKQIQRKTRTNDKTPYFSWSEPDSINDVIGYYVYFGTSKANPVKKGKLKTKRKYTHSKKIKGNEKTYYLRVRAVDAFGNKSPVSQFKYRIDTKVKRSTWEVPLLTGDGLEMRWHKPTGEYITGYYVYRAVDNETKYNKITYSLITEERFLDTTIEYGHTYKYKIRSIDDLGNESVLSTSYNVVL